MKKFWLLFFLILVSPLAILAQPIVSKPFDISKIDWLLAAGLGGIGVKAATELLKRWLKIDGVYAIGLSVVVSMAAVAYHFIFDLHNFNIGYFILYSALIALAANGLYKAGKPTE